MALTVLFAPDSLDSGWGLRTHIVHQGGRHHAGLPLTSKYGTYKTVTARLWPFRVLEII